MNTPIRFEPFLRPMVWGGRRLGDVLGKPLATAELYGESWDLSDHALHHSRAVAGPAGGRSLREMMERDGDTLLGARRRPPALPLARQISGCVRLAVGAGPSG